MIQKLGQSISEMGTRITHHMLISNCNRLSSPKNTGKPEGTVLIRSLAGVGSVQEVEIVGTGGPLEFRQDAEGLHVTVPAQAAHDYGVALRINGNGLV